MSATDGDAFPQTDAGNAELFAQLFKDRVRFDHQRKLWLVWRGHWWAEDGDGEVVRMAKQCARHRLRLAVDIDDKEDRKKELDWAMRSESQYGIKAMLELAKSEHPLTDPGIAWDADPLLLGVANGVLDLRSGCVRQGRPSDRIRLHTNITFSPLAKCPRWDRFLQEVFEGDGELIGFIHRAGGYSLTGETREQCAFLCYGEGANGKTTFLETPRVLSYPE